MSKSTVYFAKSNTVHAVVVNTSLHLVLLIMVVL